MIRNFLLKIKSHPKKEVILLGTALTLTVTVFLWAGEKPQPESNQESSIEISQQIPKGHVLIPIEISNAKTIGLLINQTGVINLYTTHGNQTIAENLKVLKLTTEDKATFSALVPSDKAALFQNIISQTKVKAALCSLNNQILKIQQPYKGRQITKIEIEENL